MASGYRNRSLRATPNRQADPTDPEEELSKLEFEIDDIQIKVEAHDNNSGSDNDSDMDSLDQFIITPFSQNDDEDDSDYVGPTSDPLATSSESEQDEDESNKPIKRKNRRYLNPDGTKMNPRERTKAYRESLTPEQRAKFNARVAEYARNHRLALKASGRGDEIQKRDKERKLRAKARETPEQREARLKRRRDKKAQRRKEFLEEVEAQVYSLIKLEDETDADFDTRRATFKESLLAASRRPRPNRRVPPELRKKRPPTFLSQEERLAARRASAKKTFANYTPEQRERRNVRMRKLVAQKREMQRKELALFNELKNSDDFEVADIDGAIEIVEYWKKRVRVANVPEAMKEWRITLLTVFKGEDPSGVDKLIEFVANGDKFEQVRKFVEGRVDYDREVTRRHHAAHRNKRSALSEEEKAALRKKNRESMTDEQRKRAVQRTIKSVKKKKEKMKAMYLGTNVDSLYQPSSNNEHFLSPSLTPQAPRHCYPKQSGPLVIKQTYLGELLNLEENPPSPSNSHVAVEDPFEGIGETDPSSPFDDGEGGCDADDYHDVDTFSPAQEDPSNLPEVKVEVIEVLDEIVPELPNKDNRQSITKNSEREKVTIPETNAASNSNNGKKKTSVKTIQSNLLNDNKLEMTPVIVLERCDQVPTIPSVRKANSAKPTSSMQMVSKEIPPARKTLRVKGGVLSLPARFWYLR